jgi:(R,R)-butanediol dehydrogenase / meso-butanediol dehydrogenase / diacetyl reductase
MSAMRAAVLHGPRDIRIETRALLTPEEGEAVVQVFASGLCGTDYRIWNGDRAVQYPLILGHEFIGEVVAVGAGVETLRPGQKVAVEPNYSCGVCPLCREGNRNLCLSRTAIGIDVNGGFAEQACLPARCCWPAPPEISDDQLMLAEPLAVVVRAVARGEAKRGESAAVLGVGALGLLAIQVLKTRGVRVLAIGRTEHREHLARAMGAEQFTAGGTGVAAEAARAFSGREGVDLVIETAGTGVAVEQALQLTHPGGRVVLTGLPHEASTVNFFGVVRRELRIIGSMIYRDEFPEAIRLLSSGAVTVDRLVTHRFPLARIQEAFAAHRSADSIKVTVVT